MQTSLMYHREKPFKGLICKRLIKITAVYLHITLLALNLFPNVCGTWRISVRDKTLFFLIIHISKINLKTLGLIIAIKQLLNKNKK